MTMDDGNSVYVGGLPYDVTEDALRHVFSVYGSVVTIKIVNDRSVKGKCYGFVTFSNPRSADDAIEDMDGKSIGGRTVRVNEVTTRGGSSNPGRGRIQPHHGGGGGGGGWDRSPDRRSDFDRNRYSDRSRERDRSQDRRKDYEHSHDFERRPYRKDHDMMDRSFHKERDFEDGEEDWRGDRSFGDNGRETNETGAREGRSQEIKGDDSAMVDDHISSSSGNRNFQVKEDLETLIKMREALQDEVMMMEDRLGEREVVCSDLQKKSKRLEDSLMNEKKLTSLRRKELVKLYKSYSRVRECTDNLKDCEHELQSLVNSAAREGMIDTDGGYA